MYYKFWDFDFSFQDFDFFFCSIIKNSESYNEKSVYTNQVLHESRYMQRLNTRVHQK